MSWNPPLNGQTGMMQRPPLPHGAPNSSNAPPGGPPNMAPPSHNLPPKGYGPPPVGQSRLPPSMAGSAPPPLNPLSQGDQRPPPPSMHNGPPPRVVALNDNQGQPRFGTPGPPQTYGPPPSNKPNGKCR